MKIVRQIGSLAFVLGLFTAIFAGSAFGLATENFGDRPIEPSTDWPKGTLVLAESPRRVYSHWVNGGEFFCYRADAAAFNEVLKKFAAIKAPAHQLRIEAGYGEVKSFGGKEIIFNWRLDVTAGIERAGRLEDGETEAELSPKLTYYVGRDAAALGNLILPENIEVVPSDDVRRGPLAWRLKEAIKFRTAKLKWAEFVGPFLEKERNELKRTWPKGRDIPIGGYVEFQSPLVKKYLPDYNIYIIETTLSGMSKLFAVSAQGEVSNLKGYHFTSMDGEGPFRNEMFSDFIRKQQIVVSDSNTAIETGKFIEELVFAPNRWMYLKHNSNDFKVFKTWVFSNEGTVRDPDWQWYAEKYDNGWMVSRRYVGPPASIVMPPRWKLVLDDKDKILEVMH